MRYANGQSLPSPVMLFQLSRILGTPPPKLYPEYLLDFGTHRARNQRRWWNHLVGELVRLGWSAEELGKKCGISTGRVHCLINWQYPPTEGILRRLEKGLGIGRDTFWRDWKYQQWEHSRLRKMRSQDEYENYR